MLKIWGRVNSINVQKVMWTVGELGIAHEREDAGMEFGKNKEPWFLALNPNGLVPVIQDGAFTLWESHAIVRYLAAKHARGTLWPAGLEDAAQADKWMEWAATTIWPVLRVPFLGLIRTPPEKRDMAAIEAAVEQLGRIFGILDAQLARTPYVAGASLTAGDIPLGCFTWRYMGLPIKRPSLPHVEAWFARLKDRPAYKKNVMLPIT